MSLCPTFLCLDKQYNKDFFSVFPFFFISFLFFFFFFSLSFFFLFHFFSSLFFSYLFLNLSFTLLRTLCASSCVYSQTHSLISISKIMFFPYIYKVSQKCSYAYITSIVINWKFIKHCYIINNKSYPKHQLTHRLPMEIIHFSL